MTRVSGWLKDKLAKLAVVLAGILVGQAVLYGPSLIGRKILLPLDLLAAPKFYLPQTDAVKAIRPQDPYRSDLLLLVEPARRFAASELRSGRLPLWAPYQFAGAPFMWPKFSPFSILQSCTDSPVILGWTQVLAAVVSGLGMYVFCRRVLRVGGWPSTMCAWCYPLTGFFVFWQGYPTCAAVYWLPLILLAVDKTVSSPSGFAPIGLSVATTLTLLSGHLDVAGQTLLTSGVYGLWCVGQAYARDSLRGHATKALLRLAAGWCLGLLLASPYILPSLDYARTGARMATRSVGGEERPPAGLSALPQIVLPDLYGSEQTGSARLVEGSETESSAAAYSGVLAALWLAPLAWVSRRHRSLNLLWAVGSVVALSWCLNVPGVVDLLRLPGLNLMSHNRLVFAASFAVLALAAVGLDVLLQGPVAWRSWMWVPAALLALLGGWCAYRCIVLPKAITTELELALRHGQATPWWWIQHEEDVSRVQHWFVRHYSVAAAWCATGLLGWWVVRVRHPWQSRLLPVAALALTVDLLWFAYGRSVQSDPKLYFPPVPVLQQVASIGPWRVIGFNCLPASLASMTGLNDIRGYDGVDPASLIALMALPADLRSDTPDYAQTQWLMPELKKASGGGIRISPVLDMLNVRSVIFRGDPPPDVRPAFQGFDYWVWTNSSVLPRVFVPSRVEIVPDPAARLRKLASWEFDARKVAYVETPVQLPEQCRGFAQILHEVPTRVTVSLRMETAGLLVLADLWAPGWQAYLDGKRVPILRTNHAIRGVVVQANNTTLEFRYWPASFAWGLRLAALAALALAFWIGMICQHRRKRV